MRKSRAEIARPMTTRNHRSLSFFPSSVPEGLEDVSKYPNLFAELIKGGWKDEDLAKVAGGNILRALEDAEKVFRGFHSTRFLK